jgi:hypothetical protein
MKKLLLLLTAGSFILSANAQENTSILFAKPATMSSAKGQALTQEQMDKMNQSSSRRLHSNATARTTSGTTSVSTWYDLWSQNNSSSSAGYYFEVAADSNIYDASTGYHIGVHGMGMSFDPTDSSYSYTNVNGGSCLTPISPAMTGGQTYTIDSFFANISYVRNNPSATADDSVIIEFVVTPASAASTDDSGAYALGFSANANFTEISYDTKARFATPHYNSGSGMRGAPYNAAPYINDCYFDSVFSKKYRYGFALNATTAGDTDINGFLYLGQLAGQGAGLSEMGITPITNINSSNQYVTTFISFKSGVAYPLGTPYTAANSMKLYAGEPTGASTWFMQSSGNSSIGYAGSYQEGLMAQNQIRYSDTGFTYPSGRHDILIPSYAFSNSATSTPTGYDVPEEAFHVVYSNVSLSTINTKTINTVSAYPNPATSELNVTYSTNNNAVVTVTLTNMVGQVVATQTGVNGKATFATSTLADGMYIYSVQANGERTTGHVAIAH